MHGGRRLLAPRYPRPCKRKFETYSWVVFRLNLDARGELMGRGKRLGGFAGAPRGYALMIFEGFFSFWLLFLNSVWWTRGDLFCISREDSGLVVRFLFPRRSFRLGVGNSGCGFRNIESHFGRFLFHRLTGLWEGCNLFPFSSSD